MTIECRAAVSYRINEPLVIETVEVRKPGPGDVLVEIKATGLCHSDLQAIEGKNSGMINFPGVPGHEAAGVVLEVGPGVEGLKAGDHVIPFLCSECRQCSYCKSGKTNLCLEMFSGHEKQSRCSCAGRPLYPFFDLGTFANYAVFREINLAKVRKDAPFDQIAYLGCGATTGLGAALFTAKVEAGSTVIVVGLGGIGLNIVQGARMAGAATIVGVDTNPRKETLARQMGVTHFVNPNTVVGDVVGHLLELTNGGGDFTFEAVGNVKAMRQALDATRMGWGVCTLVGLTPDDEPMELMPMSLLMGRRLLGTSLGGARCRTDLPWLVDQLMERRFNLDSLITHRLRLEEINEGFQMMKRGEGIRSVIVF